MLLGLLLTAAAVAVVDEISDKTKSQKQEDNKKTEVPNLLNVNKYKDLFDCLSK